MAIEPTPDSLLRVQTEIKVVKAQHTDLQTKIRQRRLVDLATLEASTIARAHRVRDQLLTAPARHAALIAAKHGLEPAILNAALVRFMRESLRSISAGPSTES
jgi:hypothetical protein